MAFAWVLACEVAQPLPKLGIWVTGCVCQGLVSLSGPWLPDYLTSEALRETERLPQPLNCSPSGSRAYHFPFAISFNAIFSSSDSATSLFNLAFSSHSSRSSRASSTLIP
jgi:hypothetical protein